MIRTIKDGRKVAGASLYEESFRPEGLIIGSFLVRLSGSSQLIIESYSAVHHLLW